MRRLKPALAALAIAVLLSTSGALLDGPDETQTAQAVADDLEDAIVMAQAEQRRAMP